MPAGREAKKVNKMRKPPTSKIPMSECTEFEMHITQKTGFSKSSKLIDFSENKLKRYIDTVKDKQQKVVLIAMLHDYISGHIAVAWRRGQPVYIKVTKA